MFKRVTPRFLPETRGIEIIKSLFLAQDVASEESHLKNILQQITGTSAVNLMPSARAGLYWILRALKPPRLYLPAYLCSSIYECALRAGTPMTFLDCKRGTFEAELDGINYEPGSLLLLVHQYGIPANPSEARRVADKFGLVLIEDVAPSLGSKWSGKPIGSFGDASILSFEYSKTISACKGGAIVYSNSELAKRIQAFIDDERGPNITQGESVWRRDAVNGLINGLALNPLIYGSFTLPLFRAKHGGFIDRSKTIKLSGEYGVEFGSGRAWLASRVLERLPTIVSRRKKVADIYMEMLATESRILLPNLPEIGESAFTHFPIILPDGKRDAITHLLWKSGVDMGFNFSYLCGGEDVIKTAPVAYNYTKSVITLPVSSRINDDQACGIAEKLLNSVRNA